MTAWIATILSIAALGWGVATFLLMFRVEKRLKGSEAGLAEERAELTEVETEIRKIEYIDKLKSSLERAHSRLDAVEAERDGCNKALTKMKSEHEQMKREFRTLITLLQAEIIKLGGDPDLINGRRSRLMGDK